MGLHEADYRGIHISDIKEQLMQIEQVRYGVWSDSRYRFKVKTNAYNFYAAGSAPNYFAGDIIGTSGANSMENGIPPWRLQTIKVA